MASGIGILLGGKPLIRTRKFRNDESRILGDEYYPAWTVVLRVIRTGEMSGVVLIIDKLRLVLYLLRYSRFADRQE